MSSSGNQHESLSLVIQRYAACPVLAPTQMVVLVSSKRTTPVAPMRFTSQLTLSFCVAREGKPDIFSCPPRYIRSSIESRRMSHSFLGRLLGKYIPQKHAASSHRRLGTVFAKSMPRSAQTREKSKTVLNSCISLPKIGVKLPTSLLYNKSRLLRI